MDEAVKDEKACCGTKKCCHCGPKAIAALVLLLLGGLIGYIMGGHNAMCRMPMGNGMPMAPMSMPR